MNTNTNSQANMGMEWIDIENLDEFIDKDSRQMFVVISRQQRYVSDPYCVWRANGYFARWPHDFPPTHFCVLPKFGV